jgi:hypothetical protein
VTNCAPIAQYLEREQLNHNLDLNRNRNRSRNPSNHGRNPSQHHPAISINPLNPLLSHPLLSPVIKHSRSLTINEHDLNQPNLNRHNLTNKRGNSLQI